MRCSMAPQVAAMHTGEVQYNKQQDKADGVNLPTTRIQRGVPVAITGSRTKVASSWDGW